MAGLDAERAPPMAARIYTRSGDRGDTGTLGLLRVRKTDARVEACGAVDELNAALGLARVHVKDSGLEGLLQMLQSDLLVLGADLASTVGAAGMPGQIAAQRVGRAQVMKLEAEIDCLQDSLPELTRFVLPGGAPLAAALHWARVVCRRAERRAVGFADSLPTGESVNQEALRYLNRLSDLLFVMARAANARSGVADIVWAPERTGNGG